MEVWRTEGIAGFWRGNLINIMRTAPFKAVNFFAFDTYHKFLILLTKEDGNIARFTAGAFAGKNVAMSSFNVHRSGIIHVILEYHP